MTTTIFVDPQTSEAGLEAYVLLRQINTMLDTCNRNDLRGEGLTVPQFAILNHATPEGVPLSEISARMLCDNSNLTGIVDRLISKGLVERRPDPQDRRVSLICLTTIGAERLRTIRPQHEENIQRRIGALPDEQIAHLRDLLRGLYHGLESELGAYVSNGKEPVQQSEARNGKRPARSRTSSRPTNGHESTNGHRENATTLHANSADMVGLAAEGMLPDHSTGRGVHTSNGHTSNGHTSNGHTSNGHTSNGTVARHGNGAKRSHSSDNGSEQHA